MGLQFAIALGPAKTILTYFVRENRIWMYKKNISHLLLVSRLCKLGLNNLKQYGRIKNILQSGNLKLIDCLDF